MSETETRGLPCAALGEPLFPPLHAVVRTKSVNIVLVGRDDRRGICEPETAGMMRRTDTIAYCQREAARLRSTLERTTTEGIKARLFARIEELDRIAADEAAEPPGFELTIAKGRW